MAGLEIVDVLFCAVFVFTDKHLWLLIKPDGSENTFCDWALMGWITKRL
jgi:hypothetical protein